jgi:preprotein translocase subunit SecG
MAFLLYTIHVLTSIFLILVVLLQQGKGADLSVFGGGATMTAFGARGAASLLHKFTVGGFVVFILTTLAIGVYQTRGTDEVIGGLPSAEEAAPAAGDEGDEESEDGGVTGVLPEAEKPSLRSPEEKSGEGAEPPPPEDAEAPLTEDAETPPPEDGSTEDGSTEGSGN